MRTNQSALDVMQEASASIAPKGSLKKTVYTVAAILIPVIVAISEMNRP